MLLHSPDASSAARGPRILVVVTEPSAPEPDPAEQAPQHPPGDPAKRLVEPRIGDADRDQAVAFLQEHHMHPAVPERSKADTVLTVLAAASWPAVILFCFATSWNYWWLMFIPIFISSIAGSLRKGRGGNR